MGLVVVCGASYKLQSYFALLPFLVVREVIAKSSELSYVCVFSKLLCMQFIALGIAAPAQMSVSTSAQSRLYLYKIGPRFYTCKADAAKVRTRNHVL